MYRATYYVTLVIDVPVAGKNFPEAYVSAGRIGVTDLVKIKSGEFLDSQLQIQSVSDSTVTGEM